MVALNDARLLRVFYCNVIVTIQLFRVFGIVPTFTK